MTFVSSIAIILQSLPVPRVDADEANRDQRLQSIAIAIARASNRATCSDEWAVESCKPIAGDRNQVAAELIVMANEETALRRNVGANECGRHECDPTRSRIRGVVYITHRARSYWQLHKAPVWTAEKWESLAGLSQFATDLAAWESAKLLAGYHWKCKTTEGAIAAFATGGVCWHKQAKYRAALVVRMRSRLLALSGDSNGTVRSERTLADFK